jgi:hypothetical protein
MNEQLLKFIELCLTDGVITDKEREVIFRKAAEFNVDIDECEIILESMIQQKNMSQNMENSSNTETQVSVPKFGGYKLRIQIEEGENPRFVDINYDDEDEFKEMFDEHLSSGFNSVTGFLNHLIPQDKFVNDLIKKYAKGSENRKIKKHPNGDYYEGKITNEKANGFGELNIMINDLLFMKYTQYIGEFANDTFVKGRVYCYNSDNEGDIIVFKDIEYIGGNYICRSINYPNKDKFEGDVVNFNRHGKGKLTKTDGSFIEGTWENDIIIKEETKGKTIPFDLIFNIDELYSDKKYQELVDEAELGELEYEDIFKDTDIAKKYLWSLMEVDLEKAFKEIDRIRKIASDEVLLNDTIGVIYKKKGEKNQDLNLLKKALNCFQSYYYSNKEFGTNRVNNVQEIINKIISNSNKKLEEKNSNLENKSTTPTEHKFVSRIMSKFSLEKTIKYRNEIKITNNYISCSKMFATINFDDNFNEKVVFNILDSETIVLIKNYTKMELKKTHSNYVDMKIIGKNSKNIIETSDFDIEDANKIREIISNLL